MLTYRGYSASVEFEPDDRRFFGTVLGLNDVIAFEGVSVDELEASFHRAVDEYLAACEGEGRAPEKAYSGTIYVRTDPETHRRVSLAAASAGRSTNQWAQEALLARLDARPT